MKKIQALVFTVGALAAPAPIAADTDRGYLTAGGVGSWQCFRFNNDMTTARQGIGITGPEPGSVNTEVMRWVQYVNGFVTAYNAVADGIYDVAADLRPYVGINSLMIIEPYCLANPTHHFDLAVHYLIDVLLPTAER